MTLAGDRTIPFRENFRYYLFLFLVALSARAAFLVFLDDPILFTKYPYFAEKVAAGEGIGNRLVDLSPFYLYFLALFHKVLNADWQLLKAVQALLGAFNCLIVFAVGTRAFGRRAGFVAGLLCALYGNLMVLESTLEPTVFVLLFNLLALYFLMDQERGIPSEEARWWVGPLLGGLFSGLSAVTKPNFLLFFPVAVGYLLFVSKSGQSLGRRVSRVAVFCLVGASIVLAITVRNYVALHDVVLITADAGKVFFHGNGKGATALEGTRLVDEGFVEEGSKEPDYAHVLYRKTAEMLSGRPLRPSEASRFWFRRTLRGIWEDPGAYLELEFKKLVYFFNAYEMHYIASAYQEYKALLAIPLVRYGMISSLAILGIGLSLVRRQRPYLIFGVILVYMVSCMLLLVQSRYRTPAVPYLCMFAGYAGVTLRDMVAERRFRPLLIALVVLAVLFGLTHLPYRDEIGTVDKWQQATKIHYQMGGKRLFDLGRYDEALSALNKSIVLAPHFAPAFNLRGKAYAILGRYPMARRDFETVIQLSPGQAKGYKNLGFLYLLQGDEEAAAEHLSRALKLAPGDGKVKTALEKLQGG